VLSRVRTTTRLREAKANRLLMGSSIRSAHRSARQVG
jgi:hypothetical protein